ncbi:YdaS family helix-turn-helix protein [Pannonibacter tanglangensis]|uniref:CI repressor n=1 Tax=Pannonibacter tanglangensis TaxID=2750084 RepID=A0ABW9ZHC3_9HYPH|nr:YdaS family helix-turn-helix protein [Pannonibacter sp. XCT-34]NBN64166.1 CI repressor [Pannonibacter sp. XCT-34]
MEQYPPLRLGLARCGLRLRDLAKALDVDPATVTRWAQKRVPAERVLDVERVTGLARSEIRPDLYGPSLPQPGAASSRTSQDIAG